MHFDAVEDADAGLFIVLVPVVALVLDPEPDPEPEPDPSPEFMPKLWARIEGPRSFSFVFQRLSRLLLTSSTAMCLLFVALNMAPHPAVPVTRTGYATYTDALSSTDNMLEHTYYSAESSPPLNSVPPEYEQ